VNEFGLRRLRRDIDPKYSPNGPRLSQKANTVAVLRLLYSTHSARLVIMINNHVNIKAAEQPSISAFLVRKMCLRSNRSFHLSFSCQRSELTANARMALGDN
jgi:hypothetical protein